MERQFELYDVAVDQVAQSVILTFLSKTGEKISLELPKVDMEVIAYLVSRENVSRLGVNITGILKIESVG